MERSGNFYKAIRLGYILISILIGCMAYNSLYEWQEIEALEPVSYTHLDVYKRQEFQRSDSFGRRSAQKTIHNYFFLKGLDLSLIHIQMCIRDRNCTATSTCSAPSRGCRSRICAKARNGCLYFWKVTALRWTGNVTLSLIHISGIEEQFITLNKWQSQCKSKTIRKKLVCLDVYKRQVYELTSEAQSLLVFNGTFPLI